MKKIIVLLVLIFVFISAICFSYELENVVLQNYETNIFVNKNVKVTFSGEVLEFYTAQKERVFPLTYNNSTYLPIRAISSLYNIPILWEGFSNTIYLDSLGQVDLGACDKVNAFERNGLYEDVALINKSVKVYLKDNLVEFYDVNGNRVFPITYKNTTYLPVRAVANLFNCYVDYDYEDNCVLLGGRINSTLEIDLLGSVISDNGDSTEFNYMYTNYNSNEPISGDIIFYIAGFNDSLCWGINLYEEDPITGRNIYEDELERIYEEIEKESKSDEFKKMLLTQKYNLDNYFPEYYNEPSGDYYFKIDKIHFQNGRNNSEEKMIKDILVTINDTYSTIISLENTNEPQVANFDYYQYDISNPIKIALKVLNCYYETESGETIEMPSRDVYLSDITPYLTSNIPQGR